MASVSHHVGISTELFTAWSLLPQNNWSKKKKQECAQKGSASDIPSLLMPAICHTDDQPWYNVGEDYTRELILRGTGIPWWSSGEDCTSIAEGLGLIPDWVTKILQVVQCSQETKTKRYQEARNHWNHLGGWLLQCIHNSVIPEGGKREWGRRNIKYLNK